MHLFKDVWSSMAFLYILLIYKTILEEPVVSSASESTNLCGDCNDKLHQIQFTFWASHKKVNHQVNTRHTYIQPINSRLSTNAISFCGAYGLKRGFVRI